MVGLWAFGCAFRKALRMQECTIVLGTCSFLEFRDKSGSTVRPARKSWKPGVGKCLLSF